MGRGRRPAPAHPIRLMAERRVRLRDGVTVTCRTEGTGLPFVWSHGMLASTALEDALGILDWRALAAERLLVRYDARGHGASSGTGRPADHEWPRLAGDLLQILNDLSLDRVTIGGDSMGVGIGLHLAAAAPERVDALVLAIPPSAWGERVAVARVYGAQGRSWPSTGGRSLPSVSWYGTTPGGTALPAVPAVRPTTNGRDLQAIFFRY